MRDYFNDPDLGKAIITELENKEIGSVAGNDGYYYEHRVKEELFEAPDTPYYVIANQKEINPVKFFGIDIPVLLKSPFKNTTETIILVGQDPLRSIEHIRDGFKDGGINTIHEGTPYAIEIDTNATKGNTSNLECYRPIIFELLKNYNVYLTDALKCWICDSTGENVSFNCLNPKLKKSYRKLRNGFLNRR